MSFADLRRRLRIVAPFGGLPVLFSARAGRQEVRFHPKPLSHRLNLSLDSERQCLLRPTSGDPQGMVARPVQRAVPTNNYQADNSGSRCLPI